MTFAPPQKFLCTQMIRLQPVKLHLGQDYDSIVPLAV